MRLLAIAIVAATLLLGTLKWQSSSVMMSARFAFDEATFHEIPEDVAAALGSPLTPADIATIKHIAQAEVEGALAGLRIRFEQDGRAFWRVWVVPTLTTHVGRARPRPNAAGASYAFGMLGGAAFINFATLALKAVVYAPPGASRDDIVRGIGRGIGRSAVHEFAHLIAGSESIHSDDENSFEYDAADRASQYYGELKWGVARPVLERKLGVRR
jgi:hypothetical protein